MTLAERLTAQGLSGPSIPSALTADAADVARFLDRRGRKADDEKNS